MTDATQRQVFDVGEVAGLFGVSAGTVYRAARDGDLTAIRVRGRVLFPRTEILRLLRLYEGNTPAASQEEPRPATRQVAA
jgi:excisionase family DNA binding protein